MANAVIRLQLNGSPTADDYERLHTNMTDYKFHRYQGETLLGRQDLPHGTYCSELKYSVADMENIVKAAAAFWSEGVVAYSIEATKTAVVSFGGNAFAQLFRNAAAR